MTDSRSIEDISKLYAANKFNNSINSKNKGYGTEILSTIYS